MTLCELAEKHGTNKAEYGYTPVYQDLTAHHPVKRILELGIGAPGLSGGASLHAASLKMWAEYLPEAEIFAVDNRREILFNGDRIMSLWADVYDSASLIHAAETFGGHFDLIVDDAVHLPDAQINAMRTLLPHLDTNGIYCIEDVANCHPDVILAEIPPGYSTHVWPCKLPFITIKRCH